jgi:hypothetical protein
MIIWISDALRHVFYRFHQVVQTLRTVLHPTKCQADVTHFHVLQAASMPRQFLCDLVVLLTEIRELLSQAWPSTNPPLLSSKNWETTLIKTVDPKTEIARD